MFVVIFRRGTVSASRNDVFVNGMFFVSAQGPTVMAPVSVSYGRCTRTGEAAD